jgi:hypothetical protein
MHIYIYICISTFFLLHWGLRSTSQSNPNLICYFYLIFLFDLDDFVHLTFKKNSVFCMMSHTVLLVSIKTLLLPCLLIISISNIIITGKGSKLITYLWWYDADFWCYLGCVNGTAVDCLINSIIFRSVWRQSFKNRINLRLSKHFLPCFSSWDELLPEVALLDGSMAVLVVNMVLWMAILDGRK